MKFDIIHDLPGRMRVHCRALHVGSDCRIELNRWLSCHEELISATISTRTGNLLVLYSKNLKRETLVTMLDDLQIFGMANMVERQATTEERVTNAVFKVCEHETLSLAKRAFLPRPVYSAWSGLHIGEKAFGLLHTLLCGDLSRFAWGVARFAIYAFFGQSTTIRVLLSILVEAFTGSEKYFIHTIDGSQEKLLDARDCNPKLLPLLPEPSVVADSAAI